MPGVAVRSDCVQLDNEVDVVSSLEVFVAKAVLQQPAHGGRVRRVALATRARDADHADRGPAGTEHQKDAGERGGDRRQRAPALTRRTLPAS